MGKSVMLTDSNKDITSIDNNVLNTYTSSLKKEYYEQQFHK